MFKTRFFLSFFILISSPQFFISISFILKSPSPKIESNFSQPVSSGRIRLRQLTSQVSPTPADERRQCGRQLLGSRVRLCKQQLRPGCCRVRKEGQTVRGNPPPAGRSLAGWQATEGFSSCPHSCQLCPAKPVCPSKRGRQLSAFNNNNNNSSNNLCRYTSLYCRRKCAVILFPLLPKKIEIELLQLRKMRK